MNDFLKNIKRFVGHLPFTRDALAMYFCMIDSWTPLHVKGTIAAALTYFLSPADAIPDMVPGFGFTDDAGVVATILATVGAYVTDEHRQMAKDFYNS